MLKIKKNQQIKKLRKVMFIFRLHCVVPPSCYLKTYLYIYSIHAGAEGGYREGDELPASDRVNPRPAGPLDFPPPAGGGGGAFERPPPMISAPGRRREKRKTAFESSRKIISKSFRSYFCSGQNWGLQGSKFQNFPKRFFDNKIFNFKDRATNLIPLCLSR